MIEGRIAGLRAKGEIPNIAKICRQTMKLVEETARFSAPKYFGAYVDVLRLHLAKTGRSELLPDDFDIGLALEFGISSRTLLSLMELGVSRMSAVALYEVIAKDDLDQASCRSWMQRNGALLMNMGIPVIIVRELREKLLGKTDEPSGPDTTGSTAS